MPDQYKNFADLLTKAQKGNRWALEMLCSELEAFLRPYFRKRFTDPEVVNDLSQETYLKFLQSFPKIREKMQLKSFVAKVAFHVTQDYLRVKYRRGEKHLLQNESFDESRDSQFPQIAIAVDSGDIESKIDMKTALAKLPAKTRKILIMKAEGYKYEEIAEKVDISVSGVKMQIKRNFEKLKIFLMCVTFWVFKTTI